MLLTLFRRSTPRQLRRSRTSPASAEALENRLVLSAVMSAAAGAEAATVTEVTLNEVELNEDNQLVANVTIAGTDAEGTAFAETVQVPLELDVAATADSPDSLSLSLGVDFAANQLRVSIDNGDGGPVTILLTGTVADDDGETDFGEVIGDLASHLDDEGQLDLETLDPAELDTLIAGTSDVLSGVLESLTTAIGEGGTPIEDGESENLLYVDLDPVELSGELSTRTGLDVVVEDPIRLVVSEVPSDAEGLGRSNLLRNVTRTLDRWEEEGKSPGRAIEAKERILDRIMSETEDVEEMLFRKGRQR